MSRESLLDDAIIKAKEAEDWQLVEWLRMARGSEKASRWYTVKLRELQSENAKLREILKSLMMGTHAELCAGRGESDCKECSMYHGEDECTVANAMELLGIDMYGEPLGIEVDDA